jgi:hypothetical protein
VPKSIGSPRPSAATLAHELVPDPTGTRPGKAVYQALSSVVHGAAHGWTQEIFETAGSGAGRIPTSPFRTMVFLVSAPLTFIDAVLRAHDQFGWDPEQQD